MFEEQNLAIEKAKIGDVKGIYEIISHFSQKGLLLPRSLSEIYDFLRDFFLCRKGDIIIATCALHIYWENLAEIRSLAVKEDYQKQGLGARLVRACLDEAIYLGIKRVFTLTYKPSFFKRLGFHEIEKNTLPPKIWVDCIKCPKYPDLCNEIAMMWEYEKDNR